jgi:hypothetical protein
VQNILGEGHNFVLPPLHTPAVQVLPSVQNLPSSHGVVFGFGTFAHKPVAV